MTFQWPLALLLLIIIPILAGLYVWMQRRRQRYALRYASISLVQQAVGKGPGIKRHIPAALYLLALTAMVLALARPQATVPVPSNTGTVILSIDVSGSMFAEDVKPDRMEATKKAAIDFVNKQPSGVKIGVVSFSDSASLLAPPTAERDEVIRAINRLQPQRGTNIGAGIEIALYAIYDAADIPFQPNQSGLQPSTTGTTAPTQKPPPASIVLVSDGQSTVGPDPLDIADEAVAAGIKVYTIGIGTPQGTNLLIQGRSVFTRLDEDTLKGVAQKTGARYYSAQDSSSLKQIYDELSRNRDITRKHTEITFAFAGAAMVISMMAGGLGLLWFNRLP